MTETHVVAVCGSLRDESYTRKSLRIALEAAESSGGSTELIDPRELSLPVFDADEDYAGDSPELRQRVRHADSILLGTPMYHGSYSSPVKTVLDYCGFDEFEGKTVGLLAVSGGAFPIPALEHLRSVCRALDAWVIPHQAAVPRASNKFNNGELTDEDLQDRVRKLGIRAVKYANIEPDPATFESDQNIGAKGR